MKDCRKQLSEFKIGEKFYDWQGVVQILLMYEEDQANGQLRYATKEWKTGIVKTHGTGIAGITQMVFYPYKGRQLNSFNAGFRFALNLCIKHMSTEEKIKAGIYRYGDDHIMMLKAYDGWKQNHVDFYDRKYINYQPDKRKVRRDKKTGRYMIVP